MIQKEEKEITLYPAFKENNFTVVFASDNNFVKYLSVAMISLIKNCSNKYNYDIVVLENNISNRNKKLLYKEISSYENVSLRFVDVQRFYDENQDVEFKNFRDDITITTYNRLFIPEIFKNYDKVLYLDCDILVKGDLSDLSKLELNNNYIGAVVGAEVFNWRVENNTTKCDEINAGVILYNIKECLKNDFTKNCLNNIQFSKEADQGAINITCKGKIEYIDVRYNFFAECLDDVDIIKHAPKYILNDIRVVHFAGSSCWFKDFFYNSYIEWYKYFFKTPFYNRFIFLLLQFKFLRYKVCIKINRGKKQNKYIKKVKVLREILR